jgi:hypothetical protein
MKEQLVLNPDVSTAVHVTEVSPYGNSEPDDGLHVDNAIPTLSDDANIQDAGPEFLPGGSAWLKSPGQSAYGGCVSRTMIANAHDTVLLDGSVATHVTGLIPTLKIGFGYPSQKTTTEPLLSVAVARGQLATP